MKKILLAINDKYQQEIGANVNEVNCFVVTHEEGNRICQYLKSNSRFKKVYLITANCQDTNYKYFIVIEGNFTKQDLNNARYFVRGFMHCWRYKI